MPACKDRHSLNNKIPGFSFLEVTLVIIAISILYVIGVDKLLKYRADAEEVSIETLLSTLKLAVSIEIFTQVKKGNIQVLAEADGANPMNYLLDQPRNYIGELQSPDIKTIGPATWYFDTDSRLLIYRVQHPEYFVSELPGPARARFRLNLVYDDNNLNQQFDPYTDKVQGLRLIPNDPYHWKRH